MNKPPSVEKNGCTSKRGRMAGKSVGIVQSSYIPWKGFFELIQQVDEFLLFDQVQYTRRDWRNRNQVKTRNGVKWLTIPVNVKGKYEVAIENVETVGHEWRREHWNVLRQSYAKSPHFNEFKAPFEELYLASEETSLSKINRAFIETIMDLLGIETKLSWSTDYGRAPGAKTDLLLNICKLASANSYLSGPSAAAYLDEELFRSEDIELHYADYEGYPEYEQPYPPFCHQVTVLDLIFNCGAEAPDYIWGKKCRDICE